MEVSTKLVITPMIWHGAVRPIWCEIPTTFFNTKGKAELFSPGVQYDIEEDIHGKG